MAKITIAKSDTSTPTNVASSSAPIPAPVQEVAAPEVTPAITEPQAATPTPPIVIEPTNGVVQPTPIEPQAEPKKEEPTNVTKISFAEPQAEVAAPTATPQAEQPKITPQDILKTIPKEELYKYLELDEHTIKFDEFRKKGGNPYDYIQQKAIDWTKVPDEQLIKMDLRKLHPNLSAEKIDKLYTHKYKQDELAAEEEREFGNILLETDADSIRRRNIEDQKKSDMPTIQAPPQPNEYEARYKTEQDETTQMVNKIIGSEPVQKFITEKKITIPLGNNKFHTFEVENPQHVINVMFGRGAQGEPDSQLLLQAALFRAAPQQFIEGLISHGKSSALLDELLKDGQNATKPSGTAPRQNGSNSNNKKITPTSTRLSNYGAQ